jgi:adenine-specific DNA-methyltransferase
MPTLSWIGKDAVVNHHREVPYRLLRDVPELGCGDPGSGNLLVEGDNLHALKALLPYYAGQVKCIYIDPPYNTGNEGWVYNDAVNSPLIQKWLGETVGKEAEDLSRHDKWLCMMYPRLQLLKQFLREDGAIFISIDDNELAHLIQLLRDIFGAGYFIANFLWKRRTTPDSRNLNGISADHEYIVCFSKAQGFKFRGAAKDLGKYSNPDADPRGPWMSDNLTGLANATERPNLHYDLVNPATQNAYPPHPSRGWIYGKERMTELIREKKILWPAKSTGRPRLKRFVTDMQSSTTGFSTILDAPGNVEATKELSELLGPKVFAFPKPSDLIKLIVEQGTSPGDLILDSFMGSGTTAHAVLKLNAAQPEQPPRRFIGIEMEPAIAKDVTAERIRRVATGYTNAKGEAVPGLGGGFRYCRLDAPLFSAAGVINPDVRFAQLARHVYFTETGEPLPRERVPNTPLVGVFRGTAVYLLFNGILGDKSRDGGNVLTRAILAELPPHPGPKVVYAYGCLLGEERLRAEQITFRQTPYEIAIA